MDLRARVFISCGQSKHSDELETARNIASRLQKLGFDPYIAVEEQTLRGLKENIFSQLENSEYFVFVDFKREQLASNDPPLHRGSLFSHQELALASFLDIPVLAFQETGVRPNDGILRFLQANCTPFTDRHLLPNVIADAVQERKWNSNFRNELVLEREPSQYLDAKFAGTQDVGRFFSIGVRNLHHRKIASNCYAYLEKAFRLNPRIEIEFRSAELKWAGYMLPNAHIVPQSMRHFDAFFIAHARPTAVVFNAIFSDSTAFQPRIHGAGDYELHYLVVSDNFPSARISVMLTLSETLDQTRFG